MRILFLCYWGIEDGLTASTVIPHLNILNRFPQIEKIYFYTIERAGMKNNVGLPTKVTHVALRSGKKYLDKFSDFTIFPSIIRKAVAVGQVDFMFCRGTPAGALGYLVHRLSGVPYAVESYEPHATYMLESRVWKRWGLRYNLQRLLESRQKLTARYLLPLTQGMKLRLIEENVEPTKLYVMPCAVDDVTFSFDAVSRDRIRVSLGIPPDCVTGIYVGKFGGMYYDDEAFRIFKFAFEFFSPFSLIILSPDDATHIGKKLMEEGISLSHCKILKVSHHQVPAYLSAADFAFGLYKPSLSKRFLSPVKVGEYWAVGLPVLMPDGIGDDSDTVRMNNAGAIFTFPAVRPAFVALGKLLGEDRMSLKRRIRNLALRHRNFDLNKKIYEEIIYALAQ